MIYDIQKASILKRFSAALLDFFLIIILGVGVMFFMSWVTKIGKYSDTLQGYYQQYGEEYGVDFGISEEDFNKLSEEEQAYYDQIFKKIFEEHPDANKAYQMVGQLPLLIITVSIFVPVLVFEFLLPLLLKNGRTVGKKVFNLGVVLKNSVKINVFALFVRSVLGKYTIEWMLPVVLVMSVFYYNLSLLICIIVLGLLLVMQIVLLIVTKTNSCIHDALANTAVVDMSSQMVFATEQELVAYKEDLHQQEVKEQQY